MLKIGDGDFKEILRDNLENNIGKMRADKFINHYYDKFLEYFYKDVTEKSSYSDLMLDDVSITTWPSNKGTYGASFQVGIDESSTFRIRFQNITVHSAGEKKYRYGKYELDEPIILDEKDWTEKEWQTILNIFNMKAAEVIEIPKCCIHAFGIPNE